MKQVLVIVGPTGVGKTKLSIELAKEFGYEIISGDSMQVYKEMDIGTAKVRKEEMEGIPHHLINIKKIDESYSCADFQSEVRTKIDEIISRGKKALVVGGTGLYLRALLYDYKFTTDASNDAKFKEKYQNYSNEELYDLLMKVDSKSASILHPNNRVRVLRALEIYEQSGTTKSENLESQNHKLIYDALVIGLDLERKLLHERQNIRVDKMIEDGLEEEVKTLYSKSGFLEGGAAKAIGYKEFFPYFKGEISLEEVKNLIKIHTHQYAKRQYTWFKNQMNVEWISVDLNDFEKTIDKAKEKVINWLK